MVKTGRATEDGNGTMVVEVLTDLTDDLLDEVALNDEVEVSNRATR